MCISKSITNLQLQVVAVPHLHEMKYAQTRQFTSSQWKLLDLFGIKETFEDSDVNLQFIIDE